ncbi:MAG: hypothetical protein ACREDY_09965 [Bradyrhizobium sp.]
MSAESGMPSLMAIELWRFYAGHMVMATKVGANGLGTACPLPVPFSTQALSISVAGALPSTTKAAQFIHSDTNKWAPAIRAASQSNSRCTDVCMANAQHCLKIARAVNS